MTDDRQRPGKRRQDERDDRSTAGPIGTVLGATLGPFGAAVGGVVDANRLAVKFSVGTGADAGDDTDDDATTIEIEDPDSNEESVEETTDADESDGTDGDDTEEAADSERTDAGESAD